MALHDYKTPPRQVEDIKPIKEGEYYRILGLNKGDGHGKVQESYIRAITEALRAAEQGVSSSSDRFTMLAEAYAVLSDQGIRQAYDMMDTESAIVKKAVQGARDDPEAVFQRAMQSQKSQEGLSRLVGFMRKRVNVEADGTRQVDFNGVKPDMLELLPPDMTPKGRKKTRN